MRLKPLTEETHTFLKDLIREWEVTRLGTSDRDNLQRWLIRAIVYFCEFNRGEPQKVTWIETIRDFKELLYANA